MRFLNRHQVARATRAASWDAVSKLGLSFSTRAAQGLQERIQGTVILPTDAAYQTQRQGYVPNFQDFPEIIVMCSVVRDVQEALRFAHRHKLWVVCRAGGHSTAGYSVNSGMVLDVAGINDVYIDGDGLRAVVGAGCQFGKLNAVLDTYGLHVPGGGCPDVAVAGYAQGGGYGLTSLMFGMHCDSLEAALIVLADGRLVRADESTNPDLFWALRGGTGNNFGVVVQFTYRLRPLGQLWGFSVGFDLDAAAAALEVMQREFTGRATPPALGHESLLVYVGPTPRYLVRGVYNGTRDEGREVIRSLLDLAGASVDIDKTGRYTELNDELLSTLPDVPSIARSISDSRYVERILSVAEWREIVDLFRRSPNDGNFIAVEPCGGAITQTPTLATAYIHRQASMDVFSWVFWMDDAERRLAEAWLDDLVEVLDRVGNGEAYQNYPRQGNTRFADMYWGPAYPDLQLVKAKYDPEGFFHYEQSISGELLPGMHGTLPGLDQPIDGLAAVQGKGIE